MSKVSLAILCLVGIAVLHLSYAQNSPQDYVRAHNVAHAQGDCKLVHLGGPYGENIAWSSGDLTGTTVVKLWVDEKPKYNYNSNSCIGGECIHYTQVVWHNSVHLGCAKVKCDNGQGTFITCNYDPPGNFVNQRPY
ncbi:hypothetical protein QYF36_018911 [Acer negundo]|nr:hypothetical protein QYF36_018911 [Acer negundo]